MRRPLPFFLVPLLTATSFLPIACTESDARVDGADASTVEDAGTDARPKTPHDAGVEDSSRPFANVYPAPHADPRQLTKLNGPVLEHPHVVPIFYGDDADRAATEAILAQLPGSAYWAGLTEYGVADITIEPSVVLATTAPTTYSLADIEKTIADLFTRSASPAPSPDGTQIYTVFFPRQTTVNQADGSPFCDYGGAYHEEVSATATTKAFSYAVVPHCSPSFDNYMVSTTHELIEAATDPFPLTNPAWAGTDKNHVGFRGEIGDLCDYGGQLDAIGAPLFGSRVERMFSNARSLKSQDPCFPELGVPFFGAAPRPADDVVVSDFVLGQVSGRGVRVPNGTSKTITLSLFSDRDIGEWRVNAKAYYAQALIPSSNVALSLDGTGGRNGDELHLSITRTSPSDGGGDVIFVTSYSSATFWIDTIYVGE